MHERRVRRSLERGEALSYQLDACVERTGAKCMVLADDGGLGLASSRWDADECEETAARMATLGLCEDSVGEVWREDRALAVLAFSAIGQRLTLGIGGPSVDGLLPEVQSAIDGAKRILA
mgnify:FL=1